MDTKKLWNDYDEQADLLYISLQRPQPATIRFPGMAKIIKAMKLERVFICVSFKRDHFLKVGRSWC